MLQTKFVEKIKTHILCLMKFFKNLAVYKIMLKTFVEPYRPIWKCSSCALHAG